MPLASRLDPTGAQLDAAEAASDLNTASASQATAELRSRLTVGNRPRVSSGPKVTAEPQGSRDYALDAARAVLMLLGVVLHSAAAYSVSAEWVVKDPENSVVLDWLLQSIHLFRMPAFFWISGYFFALTMSRGDRRVVLGRRLFRLLVPAIATWLTFNVAQEWVMAVANHKDPVETVLHGGVPIYHLWFLVDLVVMTLVAALAFALPEAVVERVRRRLPESGTVPGVLLALTAVWFACVTVARLTGLAYVQLGGMTTVMRLAYYMPFFGVGIAMYHLTGVRRTFLRVPPVLVLVAIPFGVYLEGFRHEQGILAELAAPTQQLMVWICVAVVLQLFYRLIRRESRTVSTLSDASYSIYLFHHFIMVVLVLALLPLPLGALPKFLASSVIAFFIAAMLHLVCVRRVRLLRLLFNGKWTAPRRKRAAGVATARLAGG